MDRYTGIKHHTINFTFVGPQLQQVKEIARALRCIADDLDHDQRVQK